MLENTGTGGLAWIFSPPAPPSLHLSVFLPIIHVHFQSRHRSLLVPVSKAASESLVSAVTYDANRRQHQTGLKGSRNHLAGNWYLHPVCFCRRRDATGGGAGSDDESSLRLLRRRVVFFQTRRRFESQPFSSFLACWLFFSA